MAAMKARQNKYEEQLEKLQDSVMTLSTVMQGTESLYKEFRRTWRI